MRSRISLFALFAALLLWTAVQIPAWAQSQAVQITKGPTIEKMNSTSAVIAWSTNVNANSVVKYGTDPNHLDQTAQAPWGGTTHRVTLTNLKPNTMYYFQQESGQAQGTGTQALGAVSHFKTPAS